MQPSVSYVHVAPTSNQETTYQEVDPAKQDEAEFESEFTWDLDATGGGDMESTAYDSESSIDSSVSRTSIRQINPHALAEQKKRELEQLTALSNEADEIYAFLAGELQRHALSKRSDDPDTVPHMLDVWVSAGEKYSDVITHVEASPLLRAKFLARFGRSLYVFASQVLKSTTKVYNYEELFYMTNARVYMVDSDLWRDSSALFTLDLAMETLSLASGKLTQASEELSALITATRSNDSQSEDGDDVSSVGSGDDDEVLAASALYDRYLFCLYLRANCLTTYGDVLAHYPIAFCEIIDLLTAKHTGAHNISIFSGDCMYPRKHSTLKATSANRKASATGLRTKRAGIADCIVVLSGKTTAAGIDISRSTSPSDVYGYLLTEKKVVLSSASRPILTHVAETLRALLYPFECQQVYIPLLPLSLVEFICAPVPFFMGIRSDLRLERLMAEGVILVDLDNNDIRLPPNEVLPILTDVKSRKLLHTLRKLSIWPASQRTRHSIGRGFNDNDRPIPASFVPSQSTDSDVGKVLQRHDDLTEKWSEIQNLFSVFATRLLKEVRKHCTKAPASPAFGGSSNETVVFDERGFLAMHPSLRDFCTHLFQTQLFQRSIENIWGFR
ncbi:hypothetical protein BBO99_00002352 [Phytophthora kernoviae]|uniref:UDENN domain-containing protein n=2 Tax=Phytophthora kernoviae TaxID=325452 RepID=A0A3R7KMG4_9STRA|nr:hypothetical protein G195_002846 [Phytophthora kernoviae 00238/432]KAG2529545.1 hypothetical protein JM16_002025 [Phytophthora kernoviae]KAG2530473.1 hypothetical protein JM18_002130 [Phytophthora kernoviae]RLN31308.1 hypothetical protein BBI17_002276 [Phytophthora kernoviae]RLN83171.1 hypothetical protein BBO99_00002352 [Phytophthora kernoviae]